MNFFLLISLVLRVFYTTSRSQMALKTPPLFSLLKSMVCQISFTSSGNLLGTVLHIRLIFVICRVWMNLPYFSIDMNIEQSFMEIVVWLKFMWNFCLMRIFGRLGVFPGMVLLGDMLWLILLEVRLWGVGVSGFVKLEEARG